LPLPAGVIDGAQRSIRHRLDRLERRIVAASKRRETDTMTQIGTARGALFPLGTRQERALNILPFMARHGSMIVDRMIAAARTHARGLVSDRASSASQRAHAGTRTSSGDPATTANRAESARTADA